mmetsp:Transcript_4389/g.11527  ORF Transcript_4389/g.11527 Transcript_4389/m.11527 type:complete len:111 (+) Transcript_4389:77-409(+)
MRPTITASMIRTASPMQGREVISVRHDKLMDPDHQSHNLHYQHQCQHQDLAMTMSTRLCWPLHPLARSVDHTNVNSNSSSSSNSRIGQRQDAKGPVGNIVARLYRICSGW